ncbi:MAG: pseudouridine synthase [Gammaproteobacteria bacterium]|nr:pseudouridine synthase [Gammaproteobacteria bacterium]
MNQQTTEKLQKVLARQGLGSRREMEVWIAAGRISVNGKKVGLGERVGERDIIRVDGRRIAPRARKPQRLRVLVYHKPVGEMTTRSDPEGRATVFDRLPRLSIGRWIAVGRLDLNTSGLLLFTNNGDLANRLMHPSNEVEREYAVRVFGEVSKEMLANMKKGVLLEDGISRFNSIVDGGGEGKNHWYHTTLKGGRNREVRRLWESQGLGVSRLMRIRYGPVSLPRGLRQGRWEELQPGGVASLQKSVGMRLEQKRLSPGGANRRPRR